MATPEERLDEAATLAENGGAILHDFSNGPAGRNVIPEPIAGPTPTLKQFLAQKSVEIDNNAANIAAFESALAVVGSEKLISGVKASTLASYHTFDPLEYGLSESNTGQQNTVALAALSDAIDSFLTLRPQGKVYVPFPSGEYLVGDQTELVDSWSPARNFEVRDRPLATVYLHYHGTKLKWRDGLRYGNVSGKTANIGGIIRLINVGDIYIGGDSELDGNDLGATLGSLAGQDYADYGMELFQYRRLFINAKIYIHNHLLDGLYTNGLYVDDGYTYVEGVTSLFNGRQSHSHVGGKNVYIGKYLYGQTGNGRVNISPAAGLQVEAEGADIGNVYAENGYIQPCKGACFGAINGVDFQIKGKIKLFKSEFENNLYTPLATQHKNIEVDSCIIRGCLTEFGPPSAGIALSDSIRPKIKNSTLTDRMRDGTPAYRRSGDSAAGGGILWEGLQCRFDLINSKGFATIDGTYWTIGNATGCNIDGLDLYVTGLATPLTNKEVFRVSGVDYFDNFTLYNQLSGAQVGDLTCYVTVTNAARHENNRIDTSSGAFSTSIIWGGASIAAGGRAGAIFDKDSNNSRARNFLAMHRNSTPLSLGLNGPARILSYAAAPADGSAAIRGDLIVINTPSAGGVPALSCTTAGVAGSTAVYRNFANLS